jgi:ribulose-5-phosphate 4-epimerase/fuculose-1-phosphate aldolase
MAGYPSIKPSDVQPKFASIDEERAYRKHMCALGYRAFGQLRFGQLGDGHISARDPERIDHFWMLGFGIPFRDATVDDLVLVAPDGSLAEGEGDINIAAYNIHWPILAARPDAVSVAHTHTPYGTPFSAQARPFEPMTQESCLFVFDQSLFDDEELDVVSTEGGSRIAAALGEHSLVILRNHGLLTVGGSVETAVGRFVVAERVAEAHIKAGVMGAPISTEGAKEVAGHYAEQDVAWFAFQYLVRDLIPDLTIVLQ